MAKFIQVYGYDCPAEAKRTANSEHNIRFLNSLPVGAFVYEETSEWCTRTNQEVMVIRCIGQVAEGEFGDNVFIRNK